LRWYRNAHCRNLSHFTGHLTCHTKHCPLAEYADAETGFAYLRARYYDPGTGQFLSVDPAFMLTGFRYGHVDGNPLNGSDPSGLCGMVLGPVLVMSCPPPTAVREVLGQPGAVRGPVNTGTPPALDLWGQLSLARRRPR
jgi:RHS repeat-associated protein